MSDRLSQLHACAWIAMVAFFLMGGLAQATTISIDTMSVSTSDPTQLGRISRNGVPGDWSVNPAVFPGVINATTSYHYSTLDLDLDALEAGLGFSYGGFVQLEFDSVSTTTFLSAYLDSYNPANLAANYLGDPGTSGNFFGTDPLFFQVIVPAGHDLILVLNETTPNGGLNMPGIVTVEAFSDTNFTDLAAVPEPGTLALVGCGVAALLNRRRKAPCRK